jgi:hypothetical protein
MGSRSAAAAAAGVVVVVVSLCLPDLDEGAAAPTSTVAMQPAVNGTAENGDTQDAAQRAASAVQAAAQEAAEAASFFKLQDSEQPLDYAVRVFQRLYSTDIQKVCSMEVRLMEAGRQCLHLSGFQARLDPQGDARDVGAAVLQYFHP